MKNEYKNIYDKITPDDELASRVLDMANGEKKRIPFKQKSKKYIAVAAAFAIILSVGMFGVPRIIDNDKNVTTANPTVNSKPLDFQIVAYAEDDPNGTVKELKDGDITLMNVKISLNHSNDGDYISGTSEDDGLCVKTDNDIDYVTFACENGKFSYLDNPMKRDMVKKNEYYSAVIPISEQEAEEYQSGLTATGGVNTLRYKKDFLDNLLKQKDCSQYIYDESFDTSRILDYEYSVDVSDMAGEDEHYYDFCVLVWSKEKTGNILRRDSYIEAKIYQPGDKIEYVYYSPDGAETYLFEHPDTPYNELPTDTITITVHYKTGQTITKQLLTSFNDDGVMQMQYK